MIHSKGDPVRGFSFFFQSTVVEMISEGIVLMHNWSEMRLCNCRFLSLHFSLSFELKKTVKLPEKRVLHSSKLKKSHVKITNALLYLGIACLQHVDFFCHYSWMNRTDMHVWKKTILVPPLFQQNVHSMENDNKKFVTFAYHFKERTNCTRDSCETLMNIGWQQLRFYRNLNTVSWAWSVCIRSILVVCV